MKTGRTTLLIQSSSVIKPVNLWLLSAALLCLTSCATTSPPPQTPGSDAPIVETPDLNDAPIATPDPEPVTTAPALPDKSAPTPPAPEPPELDVAAFPSGFAKLEHWANADPTPGLRAFKKGCEKWASRKDEDWLNPNLPEYGRIRDWRNACWAAKRTPNERIAAISFFQSAFEPVGLSIGSSKDGLLTGYYAPQIDVRRKATSVYSEPILARPKNKSVQSLARKDINARSSKVLAYGKPIDVFFLQIQGSGRIKFSDGLVLRAAYDGHNSRSYVSIGSVLIRRGEMTKDQASKQAIEQWMIKAGPRQARALMNENPRYIFFKTELLKSDDGPKGSMGVPLTAMGSMAVDPRYHPYGSLVWVETTLPQKGGDYRGRASGILLSPQDTGNAIKGPLRGDLFFGAGFEAGEKAGVMKHKAMWTILLPTHLAMKALAIS